jgi:hypothetical protein
VVHSIAFCAEIYVTASRGPFRGLTHFVYHASLTPLLLCFQTVSWGVETQLVEADWLLAAWHIHHLVVFPALPLHHL